MPCSKTFPLQRFWTRIHCYLMFTMPYVSRGQLFVCNNPHRINKPEAFVGQTPVRFLIFPNSNVGFWVTALQHEQVAFDPVTETRCGKIVTPLFGVGYGLVSKRQRYFVSVMWQGWWTMSEKQDRSASPSVFRRMTHSLRSECLRALGKVGH